MTVTELAALLAQKRLLIFDFDGTIADSSPLHDRAFNEAFAGHGVAVDYAKIAGLRTDAAVDLIAAGAGVELSDESRTSLIRDKQARARRLIEHELVALAGAIDFIRGAEGRYALALCTSASRITLELALARLGLDGCFEPIVTAEDVAQGKPDPEGFLKAAGFHGVAAGEALVLEDADSGLAAARAAGMAAIRIVAGPATDSHSADWASLNLALKEVSR